MIMSNKDKNKKIATETLRDYSLFQQKEIDNRTEKITFSNELNNLFNALCWDSEFGLD